MNWTHTTPQLFLPLLEAAAQCVSKQCVSASGGGQGRVERVCGGGGEIWARSLSLDSREVGPGTVFFALPGLRTDGRRYIRQVPEGACVVAEREGFTSEWVEGARVPVYLVESAERVFVECAKRFYVPDFSALASVAVTGTNGKTTVAWILSQALSHLTGGAVYVGTLGIKLFQRGNEVWHTPTNLTTPAAVPFFQELRRGTEHGAQAVVCEVSSHAINQGRLSGVPWRGAVFTNLSRDHLDYHGTFEEYGETKARLFLEEPRPGFSVVNLDDPWGQRIFTRVGRDGGAAGFTRAGAPEALLSLDSLPGSGNSELASEASLNGTTLRVTVGGETLLLSTRLIGDYNRENVLAAATALLRLGYSAGAIANVMPLVRPVPGRLEPVGEGEEPVKVFVDYAHTPDALTRAQRSLRELTTGRFITVFGCGGDRDRGKRPQMAAAVAQGSDFGVVTSDNPRSEDPEAICREIEAGFVGAPARFLFKTVVNRREAIEHTIAGAQPGDTILIAGKGHEEYQEIAGVRHPFSDHAVALSALRARFG